ncbi:hypothetical protein BIV57_17925 [Mangrovactinospora gilvigrisea]|uniref:Uncharacterized protein n=1 Tax=Mangrovactinospora gilvigrisea TaxID=1428644 RepID=A0A1J7C3I5_9ACTN|nr:hypothetical protein [Mangrovactinospora gilvigrisea]OIV36116.1 hypothetical protein BIV57_17925 [Mangrovactinospora gilvigrisea]
MTSLRQLVEYINDRYNAGFSMQGDGFAENSSGTVLIELTREIKVKNGPSSSRNNPRGVIADDLNLSR